MVRAGCMLLAHYYHQAPRNKPVTYQQMLIKDPSYENAMLAIGLIYLEQDSLDIAFRRMDTQIAITDPGNITTRDTSKKKRVIPKKQNIGISRHWLSIRNFPEHRIG